MAALSPAPASLRPLSPEIAPWFVSASAASPNSLGPTMQASGPGGSISFAATTPWYAPTTGMVSIFARTGIAPTLDPLGDLQPLPDLINPSFGYSGVYVLLRLIPESFLRLRDLLAGIPDPASGATAVPGRPSVMTFVAEIAGPVNVAANNPPPAWLMPSLGTKLTVANLGLDASSGTLRDGARPMTKLVSPGQQLLGSGPPWNLWAFDDAGLAIDPGAVAQWWNQLCLQWNNLSTSGATGVASVASGITAHMTDPHGGPPPSWVRTRVLINGSAVPASGVSSAVGGSIVLTLSSATNPDLAPVARVAALPTGPYSTLPLTLSNLQPRDFLRIGVLDVESHLVGVDRGSPDQATASSMVIVGESPTPMLLTNSDAVAAALLSVVGTTGVQGFVAPGVDLDWGPANPVPPNARPATAPAVAPAIALTALVGGGAFTGDFVTNQQVLVTVTLSSAEAGCWVRVWPTGFDPKSGLRISLDGGAGLVAATGVAQVIVTLPDGTRGGDLAFDIQLSWSGGSRTFPDLRSIRPDAIGGQPTTSVASPVFVCELGAAAPLPLPANASAFVPSAPPVLVASARMAPGSISAPSLDAALAVSQAPLVVARSPYRNAAPSSPDAALVAATPNVSSLSARDTSPAALATAGSPLPGQQRLEVFASAINAGQATAVVGSTPPLGRYHETNDHRHGHPWVRADAESHGTGVVLTGVVAGELAELARDRRSGLAQGLAAAHITAPFGYATTGGGGWAAALRTSSAISDADSMYLASVSEPGADQDIQAQFGGSLSPAALRALRRRYLAGRWGIRESEASVKAALSRAQNLVYIEGPWLDQQWLTPLLTSLSSRARLHVIVAVGQAAWPGIPAPMGRVFRKLTRDAVAALEGGGHRVAVFTPSAGPGRSLRFASTTVVVDDVYCLTGTTHLTKRGLRFDASLAVATFDAALVRGRCADIVRFRTQLVADALGVPLQDVPELPADLVRSIRGVRSGISERLAVDLAPVDDGPATEDLWNLDGSLTPAGTLSLEQASLIKLLAQSELVDGLA